MTSRPSKDALKKLLAPSLCLWCKHFDAEKFEKITFARTCKAFPERLLGIPGKIFEGRIDHRKPYPSDKGIQFAKDENNMPPFVQTWIKSGDFTSEELFQTRLELLDNISNLDNILDEGDWS